MSAINMLLSKLLEVLNLGWKSDAVEVSRTNKETSTSVAHNENVELPEEQEEEITESLSDDEIEKKTQTKKDSNSEKQDDYEEFSKPSQEEQGNETTLNVQAIGNVTNIVNCKGIRIGETYYFGPVTKLADKSDKQKNCEENVIKKDNFIRLLMEATIKPDHDFMDYISKNLGKNWHTIFRALGYTEGRIETAEINAAGYGISEARYKLLWDWVTNDDNGTLGRLASLLWEEGERSIVKDLSIMYKKSKK